MPICDAATKRSHSLVTLQAPRRLYNPRGFFPLQLPRNGVLCYTTKHTSFSSDIKKYHVSIHQIQQSQRPNFSSVQRWTVSPATQDRRIGFHLKTWSTVLPAASSYQWNRREHGLPRLLLGSFSSISSRAYPPLPPPKRFSTDRLLQRERPSIEIPPEEGNEENVPGPNPTEKDVRLPDEANDSNPEALKRLDALWRLPVSESSRKELLEVKVSPSSDANQGSKTARTTSPSSPATSARQEQSASVQSTSGHAGIQASDCSFCGLASSDFSANFPKWGIRPSASGQDLPAEQPSTESGRKVQNEVNEEEPVQPHITPTSAPDGQNGADKCPVYPPHVLNSVAEDDIQTARESPVPTPFVLKSVEGHINTEGVANPLSSEPMMETDACLLTLENFHLCSKEISDSLHDSSCRESDMIQSLTPKQKDILISFHLGKVRSIPSFYEHRVEFLMQIPRLFTEMRSIQVKLSSAARGSCIALLDLARMAQRSRDSGARIRAAKVYGPALWTIEEFRCEFSALAHMVRFYFRQRAFLSLNRSDEHVIGLNNKMLSRRLRTARHQELRMAKSKRLDEEFEVGTRLIRSLANYLINFDPFPISPRILSGPSSLSQTVKHLIDCRTSSHDMKWDTINHFGPGLPSKLTELTYQQGVIVSLILKAKHGTPKLRLALSELWYSLSRIRSVHETMKSLEEHLKSIHQDIALLETLFLLVHEYSIQAFLHMNRIRNAVSSAQHSQNRLSATDFQLIDRRGTWSHKKYRDQTGQPVTVLYSDYGPDHGRALARLRGSRMLSVSVEEAPLEARKGFMISVANEKCIALIHCLREESIDGSAPVFHELDSGGQLQRLLESPSIVKIGYDTNRMSEILNRHLSWYLTTTVDVRRLSEGIEPNLREANRGRGESLLSLSSLVKYYFKMDMLGENMSYHGDKIQRVDWTRRLLGQPSPELAIDYAAAKAYAPLQLLTAIVATPGGHSALLSQANGNLQIHKLADRLARDVGRVASQPAPDQQLYDSFHESPIHFMSRDRRPLLEGCLNRLGLRIRRTGPSLLRLQPVERKSYLAWHIFGVYPREIAMTPSKENRFQKRILGLLTKFDLPFYADNLIRLLLPRKYEIKIDTRQILELRSKYRHSSTIRSTRRKVPSVNNLISPYQVWHSEDLSIAEVSLICFQTPNAVLGSILRGLSSDKRCLNDLEQQLKTAGRTHSLLHKASNLLHLKRSSANMGLEVVGAPFEEIQQPGFSRSASDSKSPGLTVGWGSLATGKDVDQDFVDDISFIHRR